MPHHKIYIGDTLEVLKTMPDESVDCIITSPPYWGLRDYGESTYKVWDGDPNCEHEWDIIETKRPNASGGKTEYAKQKLAIKGTENYSEFVDYHNRVTKSSFCKKCGAWYGQLGLEPTLNLYLKHLLQITKELKRVLKPTGVMFWNHNDCYSGSGKGYGSIDPKYPSARDTRNTIRPNRFKINIPQKCMCLQNYRLILRMIDEQGWILRNVIIWHKPNHMPSSVKDRFTNAYEPVFMLVKKKKYWFDLDAVRVPHSESTKERCKYPVNSFGSFNETGARLGKGIEKGAKPKEVELNPLGKNPGDLWTIPTQPFPEAHFATFPERLVEPMIKAGCPQWICKKCGFIRERITKVEYKTNPKGGYIKGGRFDNSQEKYRYESKLKETYTIGWTSCNCNAGWRPGIVLDPFAGSGTTNIVAEKLGRDSIGIELNPKYVEIIKKRFKPYIGQVHLDGTKTELEIIDMRDKK